MLLTDRLSFSLTFKRQKMGGEGGVSSGPTKLKRCFNVSAQNQLLDVSSWCPVKGCDGQTFAKARWQIKRHAFHTRGEEISVNGNEMHLPTFWRYSFHARKTNWSKNTERISLSDEWGCVGHQPPSEVIGAATPRNDLSVHDRVTTTRGQYGDGGTSSTALLSTDWGSHTKGKAHHLLYIHPTPVTHIHLQHVSVVWTALSVWSQKMCKLLLCN